jgi:hypothetical protein
MSKQPHWRFHISQNWGSSFPASGIGPAMESPGNGMYQPATQAEGRICSLIKTTSPRNLDGGRSYVKSRIHEKDQFSDKA